MRSYTYRESSHKHSLMLKENFHAKEGEFCRYCEKPILCSSSVYACHVGPKSRSCAFILHKYCALPETYMHPMHDHILNLFSMSKDPKICSVCHKSISDAYYCQQDCRFCICLKCAIPLQENGSGLGAIQHWSHRHPLLLLERYATFECDGCNKVATDFSYLCDICSFWIHKSCASLPQFNLFGIHHKHPLQISDSLPQLYQKFTQFCKICDIEMDPSRWLYYCANCRFFAHIHCALSRTQDLRTEDYWSEYIHLPAPDEIAMNSILRRCIKRRISPGAVEPHLYIKHWSHEHRLARKKKSALITADDNSNPESERLITCWGCTTPISSTSDDADIFYECNQCDYSLHRNCAEFPKEVRRDSYLDGLLPSLDVFLKVFHGSTFLCDGCHVFSRGFRVEQMLKIREEEKEELVSLDVWCACLPEYIKHQAHQHPLEQSWKYGQVCKACRCLMIQRKSELTFKCGNCDFYIHRNCALSPRTIAHRWDPHPLRLVLSLEDDVEDHPHDFQCEYCSEVIDTNSWFYHCNVCDLSFHLGDCLTACTLHVKVRHFGDLTEDYGSPVTCRATLELLND